MPLKIYALFQEVSDQYSNGTHEELIDLFSHKELAEKRKAELEIQEQGIQSHARKWEDGKWTYFYPFSIEQVEVNDE